MEKDKDYFSVICPDGTKRYYELQRNFSVSEFMDWNTSALPHATAYLLIREEFPNGRQICYEWPKSKKDVWQIKSCDMSRKTTYAWARFYPHNGKGDKSHGDYGIETSDGRHLEFVFFSQNKIHQLKVTSILLSSFFGFLQGLIIPVQVTVAENLFPNFFRSIFTSLILFFVVILFSITSLTACLS